MGMPAVRDCHRAGGVLRILPVLFLFSFVHIGEGWCQSAASLFSRSPAFSEKDIISPVAGTWGNKQPLLINVPDGYEVYYSISGSDPLLFGFAYDGPSLIDQEGDVHLKITTVDRTGRRSDYSIDYSVTPASRLDAGRAWSEEQKSFVRMISANPVRKYTAGSVLSIPAEFSYRTDGVLPGDAGPSFSGSVLSFGAANNVVRFIPFVVTDGETLFRFIVRTAAAQEKLTELPQLPFRISDWETVLPLDASYSFRIDDGEWKGKLTALQVDRSETHILFWKPEGEVDDTKAQMLVLYPKPTLQCSRQVDGSCLFTLSLAAPYLKEYRLGRSGSPSEGSMRILTPAAGLHESLVMDAFKGEDVSGVFTSGVYLGGVYQGELSADFHLDRLPPQPPVITSARQDGLVFSDDQEVCIESEAGSRLFYAVSAGVPLEGWEAGDLMALPSSAEAGDFVELAGNSFRLATIGGRAAFYRISAYAVDAAGNKGGIAELPLLVTGKNIYLRAATDGKNATDGKTATDGGPTEVPAAAGNGSYDAPFSSFEQAVSAINANGNLILHVQGDVPVQTTVKISSPCVIEGSNASLQFLRDGNLVIEHANVVFKGGAILKDDGSDSFLDSLSPEAPEDRKQPVFITVQDGSLHFDSCDVSAYFAKEGKLVGLYYSALSSSATSFSAYSSSYSALFTAYTSHLDLAASTCAVSSYTALIFCMVDSDLRLDNSLASVSCYTGRIAELSGGSYSFLGNVFNGALRAEGMSGDLTAVRTSGETRKFAYESNQIRGFRE